MDWFDLSPEQQCAAIARDDVGRAREHIAALDKEIQLLRAARQARQAATPHAQMTPAEIRLRAFEQARAARGMAKGFECVGNARKTQDWLTIANDFERAAARITQPAQF